MAEIRYKWIAGLLAILLVLTMEAALAYQFVNPRAPDVIINQEIRPHVSTKLIGQVYGPDGILKATVTKDNDLILDNFKKILIGTLFQSFINDNAGSFTMLDTGNASRTIKSRANTQGSNDYLNRWVDGGSGTDPKGAYMGIGTGSTAAVRWNSDLQTIHGVKTAVTNGYATWTTATGDITITSTIACTSSVSITEGSVFIRWLPDSGTTTYYFMLTRDTFAGVAVDNGDTFVLTVIINLSSDFNNNIGSALAAMLTYRADESFNSFTGTNTANAARTVGCYIGSGIKTYGSHLMHADNLGGSGWVEIGTSSAAVARTNFGLSATVETRTAASPTPSISGNTLTIQADILCTEARSIREAGFLTQWSYTDLEAFLLFRVVFAPVSIAVGQSIRVLFTITF